MVCAIPHWRKPSAASLCHLSTIDLLKPAGLLQFQLSETSGLASVPMGTQMLGHPVNQGQDSASIMPGSGPSEGAKPM